MKLFCNGRNLYIANKVSNLFCEILADSEKMYIMDGKGVIVSNGTIVLEKVHACLHCRSLRNITLIIRGEDAYKVSLILETEQMFDEVLEGMKGCCPALQVSEQNKKINGYAAALVEKLREGIALTILDTKEQEEIIYCPDCGMQCDSSIPYCMECGASIS